MGDYRAGTEVHAPAQHVFDYLADVANLPRYFERMTSAESAGPDAVRVTADLGDREVEGEAWFKVDRDSLALSWGSEGPNDYHGQLEVSPAGDDAVRVAVTLSTTRAGGAEIQHGLEETMANITRIIEGSAQ